MDKSIQEPSKEIIANYIQSFNEKEKAKEEVLSHLFKRFETVEDIMAQTFMLNALYSTHVDSDSLVTISKAISSEELINEILRNSGESADSKCKVVHRIADLGSNNVVSFASKYCNWICWANKPQCKNSYPIYDRYSRGMVWKIGSTFLSDESPKTPYYSYDFFIRAFENVHSKYASEMSYKEFDKYLWACGKEHNIYIE